MCFVGRQNVFFNLWWAAMIPTLNNVDESQTQTLLLIIENAFSSKSCRNQKTFNWRMQYGKKNLYYQVPIL